MARTKKVKVSWQVPSTKAEMKELQNAIVEASNSKLRQEAEQDHITSIFEELNEKFGMTRRTFNQWVKIYHKQAYADTVATLETTTTEYAEVMSGIDESVNQ